MYFYVVIFNILSLNDTSQFNQKFSTKFFFKKQISIFIWRKMPNLIYLNLQIFKLYLNQLKFYSFFYLLFFSFFFLLQNVLLLLNSFLITHIRIWGNFFLNKINVELGLHLYPSMQTHSLNLFIKFYLLILAHVFIYTFHKQISLVWFQFAHCINQRQKWLKNFSPWIICIFNVLLVFYLTIFWIFSQLS